LQVFSINHFGLPGRGQFSTIWAKPPNRWSELEIFGEIMDKSGVALESIGGNLL